MPVGGRELAGLFRRFVDLSFKIFAIMIVTLLLDYDWEKFLPFTWTRPTWDLRIGIFTFLERISKLYGNVFGYTHRKELRGLFSSFPENKHDGETILLLPTIYFKKYPNFRKEKDTLFLDANGRPFGAYLKKFRVFDVRNPDNWDGDVEKLEEVILLQTPWEFLDYIHDQIIKDHQISGKKSFKPYKGVAMISTPDIFIDTSVTIETGVILDASKGSIFIDSGAVIRANSYIEGPAYIGRSSVVQPMTRILGNVAIGPVSKVGGEITNSIIWGYSNKQHDGFMGHTIVAEWVNIGAGTNFSNLKNTYGKIKAFYYPEKKEIDTGRQFLGAMVGPHAKIGINTAVNSGTVMGAFTFAIADRIVSGFVPDFTWIDGSEVPLDKALEIAERMMSRRDFSITDIYADLIKHIKEESRKYVVAKGSGTSSKKSTKSRKKTTRTSKK